VYSIAGGKINNDNVECALSSSDNGKDVSIVCVHDSVRDRYLAVLTRFRQKFASFQGRDNFETISNFLNFFLSKKLHFIRVSHGLYAGGRADRWVRGQKQ
jgi:hypothetical protein